MHINNQALLRSTVFLGGKWVAADDGATFAVRDPAGGSLLAEVANCGATETRRAIAAADAALPAWRTLAAKQRSQLLQRWFALINHNAEDLAQMITAEGGKVVRAGAHVRVSGGRLGTKATNDCQLVDGDRVEAL